MPIVLRVPLPVFVLPAAGRPEVAVLVLADEKRSLATATT